MEYPPDVSWGALAGEILNVGALVDYTGVASFQGVVPTYELEDKDNKVVTTVSPNTDYPYLNCSGPNSAGISYCSMTLRGWVYGGGGPQYIFTKGPLITDTLEAGGWLSMKVRAGTKTCEFEFAPLRYVYVWGYDGKGTKIVVEYLQDRSPRFMGSSGFETRLGQRAWAGIRDGFNSIDPYARFKERLTHVLDLRFHDSSTWAMKNGMFTNPEDVKKAARVRASAYNLYSLAGVLGISGNMQGYYRWGDVVAYITQQDDGDRLALLHEDSHLFGGLEDEYITSMGKPRGVNCRAWGPPPGTVDPFTPFNRAVAGCIDTQHLRPSFSSVMNSPPTTKFNATSCAFIAARFTGYKLEASALTPLYCWCCLLNTEKTCTGQESVCTSQP